MYIDVNNIKIYYEVLGEGKPIILLNPNSVNTGSMNFIAKTLSRDFKVYKFDRRGCGKSERNCPLTYEESAKDIYEFIKKLNIDKPYLLGSSGGAGVALNVAINYPDSISKLVTCSGVARYSKMVFSSFSQKIRKLTFLKSVRNAEKFYKLNETAKELTLEDLSKITVPTLVVNGGKKDIVPIEEAEYLASSITNSELLILGNEGNFSYVLNCKWYDRLKEFLNK